MTSIGNQIFLELNSYYPEKISFLRYKTPFEFLVTVILSASSTDVRAQAAADRLFARYNDEYGLAKADVADVELLIRDVGLSKGKSKNIVSCANRIVELGYIPDNMQDLIKLDGVGEKTASCYLSEILGQPAVIADIHFVRVAMRLGLTDTDDRNKSAREIRDSFPPEMWTRLSMTVNLHGRVVCKPKPKCQECFLAHLCRYYTKKSD